MAYLGPPGTFTEEAAQQYLETRDTPLSLRDYSTIDQVVEAVQRGEVDQGLVPLENSLEGGVSVTLDLLANSQEVYVNQEMVCGIEHCLLADSRSSINDIKELYSHPQVFSQCRTFIREHLPGVKRIPWHSTAAAASMVINTKGKGALASRRAAQLFQLEVLASSVQDGNGNQTRFVVIDREDHPYTGKDKTSLVVYIKDGPGSLYEILRTFALHRINLTRIESRPARKSLGDYLFFIDLEGHREEQEVKTALGELKEQVLFMKMLGSYPRQQ